MKWRWLTVFYTCFLVSGFACARLHADAIHYDSFLEQLKSRGWYDTALLYLEEIEQDPNLPETIRTRLLFDQAQILLDSASATPDFGLRQERLKKAKRYLETFLSRNPDHSLVANARLQFGKLLMERGRIAALKAKQPFNRSNRDTLNQTARTHFQQAQSLLEKSRAQYKAQLDSFKNNLRKNSPEAKQRQDIVEKRLQALIDLAVVLYEMAQSYEPGSADHTQFLQQAANSFEKIHNDHRNLGAGLYARLYQGKCLEETNDVRKARGIYDELLGHDPLDRKQSADQRRFLLRLQHQAHYFRMICLNHKKVKAFQSVIEEAEQWLRDNSALRATEVGLGIEWELAKALESLANTESTSEKDTRSLLRKAFSAAEHVSTTPGKHREAALSLLQHLRGTDAAFKITPQDFSQARELAQAARSRAEALQQELYAEEPSRDTDKQRMAALKQWSETAALFHEALKLADQKVPVEDINHVRFHLSYAYYYLGRNYESAIVAERIARGYPEHSLSKKASFLMIAAYLQAYNQRPGQSAFEVNQIIRTAQYLLKQWPTSNESNQTRIILGGLYGQQGDPDRAAKWFGAVTESSEHYLESRQKAGMAYWNAFLRAKQLPASKRPNQTTLKKYAELAQQILEDISTESRGQIPIGEPVPDPLLTSELYLAQIAIHNDQYPKALSLLVRADSTGGNKHPGLLELVQNKEPLAFSGRSRHTFVAEVYKTALRVYVGLGDLASAKQMINELEKLGTSAGPMVQVYRELGTELQIRIETLQKRNDLRERDRVMKIAESFLEKINQGAQETPLRFSTMSWMADAYYQMGKVLIQNRPTGSDNQRSKHLFSNAAKVMKQLIKMGETDPNFLPQQTASTLRLAQKLRLRLARYQRYVNTRESCKEAYTLVRPLLIQLISKPNPALPVQVEAAYILQAWGQHDTRKLHSAIRGVKSRNKKTGNSVMLAWGWAGIAQRLQHSPSSRKGASHYSTYYEARFQLAYCLFQQARRAMDNQKQEQLYTKAKREIMLTYRLSGDFGGNLWKNKFNDLLVKIQRGLQEPATGISVLRKPRTKRAINVTQRRS